MIPPPHRIEPLEARIAPAAVQNPLPDFIGGAGQTTASIDLSKMFDLDPAQSSRTHVRFITNADMDLVTPGIQGGVIDIELYDDLAPLSVQNFLTYLRAGAKNGYDNTIFHRSFDFQDNNAGDNIEDNDIIQGGGFAFPRVFDHIRTLLPLHNEFNPALPNVRGTLAMAKIGGDPHSATSEWFFNVNDNTSILGAGNNGGFTVFGAVTPESLAVLDRISEIRTFGFNTFADLPLQNYNADPDNNPNTASPAPTADNYVRILGAQIVPGNSPGFTYTVSVAPVGGAPANLLRTSITGSTLNLTFSGQSGQADVTVTGQTGSETASDTFRVTLGANLIASATFDGFQPIMVPGDAARFSIQVSNSGSATYSGPVKVEYFLSRVAGAGSADPEGTLVDGEDILIGSIPGKNISIAAGRSTVITTNLSIAPGVIGDETVGYRILARVTPLSGSQLLDLTDDDVASLGRTHALFNQFGTLQVGTGTSAIVRSGVALHAVIDDGNPATTDPVATFTLRGDGNGRLVKSGGDYNLSITGTDADSRVTAITTRGQRIELHDITVAGGLSVANLGAVDLDGTAAFGGGVRRLVLGDLTGPGVLTIGALLPANNLPSTVTLGSVRDYAFESAMPIGSLTAREWLDTGGVKETLSFHTLGRLNITGASGGVRGDLQADVEVTAGVVTGIRVAGFLDGSVITTIGDIGSVVLGGMRGSSLFAGTSARPAMLADFFSESTISTFVISGIRGFTGDLFADAQVAAHDIGAISVRQVAPANGGEAFGFVADAIRSYNRIGGARLARLDAPGSFDTAGDYRVAVL